MSNQIETQKEQVIALNETRPEKEYIRINGQLIEMLRPGSYYGGMTNSRGYSGEGNHRRRTTHYFKAINNILLLNARSYFDVYGGDVEKSKEVIAHKVVIPSWSASTITIDGQPHTIQPFTEAAKEIKKKNEPVADVRHALTNAYRDKKKPYSFLFEGKIYNASIHNYFVSDKYVGAETKPDVDGRYIRSKIPMAWFKYDETTDTLSVERPVKMVA